MPELIQAFGEGKTLREWARDPRCRVSSETLRARLARGSAPEQAMSEPAMERSAAARLNRTSPWRRFNRHYLSPEKER